MRRLRNIKIVATLGPSSNDYKTIKRMFEAGADVFRLNMSHGCHETIQRLHSTIREIEDEMARPIGILVDLQGPKLRVGDFQKGQETLNRGDKFVLDLDSKLGDKTRVCLPHPEIFKAIHPQSFLLVNDGKIKLRVDECREDYAVCTIIEGGEISNHKGVNVPDVVLPLAALSKKDRQDLEFACELGIDWLALSFVQKPEDIQQARSLVKGRASIMTKVEKPAAVKCFDDILNASDGIMIARGDLGVELPIYTVPPIQKSLIRKCRAMAKPVIVATQMLESMTVNSTPTRAEVSDVATAIYEGADAVMLSAESAAGQYPVESIMTMNNVALSVEKDPTFKEIMKRSRGGKTSTVPDSITLAARQIAENTEVKAICCFTHSGTTARLVAREKPTVPIIVLTPFRKHARKLTLLWGGHCEVTDKANNFDEAVAIATTVARAYDFGKGQDHIIITAGVPFNVSGSTNIVQVAKIGTD
ncbi:MAG: pyruvate kinase [Rhodobacteraceae bacterium]|nr:pyruvate kinase [Paracoccaceae bacterium]